jgi:hypothetical protein
MDPVMNIEPARIDELLGAYRELQSQFDRVLDRLRRAEENKHTVQRRIYDRVAGEYNRELDGLRAKMSPLRDELERVQESLETQCRSANTAIQAVEDELAEADFRHRIGEYEASDFVQLRHSLDARSEEARTRQALFQATLAAIEAMRSPALQPVSNVTPASDVAEPAPDEIALAEPEVPVVESNEPDVVVGVEAAVEEVLAAAPAASTIESAPRRPVLSARSTVAPARVDGFETRRTGSRIWAARTHRARNDAAPKRRPRRESPRRRRPTRSTPRLLPSRSGPRCIPASSSCPERTRDSPSRFCPPRSPSDASTTTTSRSRIPRSRGITRGFSANGDSTWWRT